jgi:hypothetical protein
MVFDQIIGGIQSTKGWVAVAVVVVVVVDVTTLSVALSSGEWLDDSEQ